MMETMLVSSLTKAGLEKAMTPLTEGKPLIVCRSETISFQIVFRDSNAGADTRVSVSRELYGEKGKCIQGRHGAGERTSAGKELYGEESPGEDKNTESKEGPEIRVRRVLNVMCRRSCNPESYDQDYLFYDARMAPDLLRDVAEEMIPVTGEWQSLWIDIFAGERHKPGMYRLVIRLMTEGGETAAACSVEIRVIGQVLPPLPILHTEWFHCDGIADYYGVDVFSEEFWRIFRNFIQVYVKRGGNMIYVPILTPPLDTEVGLERTTVQLVKVEQEGEEYCFDFSDLGRFLDICLEEGIAHFEINHLFTQWGATAAPKVVAWTGGECRRIFGWDTSSDDPGYLRFLGVLIPALKEYLKGRGLLDHTYFHISDEPNPESVQYQTSQGAVRHLLEGCTIIEAVSDYEYYAKGLVDIPVCATNHIEPFLENRPPVLWSYFCCSQTVEVPNRFISMPSWRNRIYGILLYWLKIDGFLHWGFNFYNSMLSKKKINPYDTVDADGGFPAGDPFLVYPGKDGIPEESIRIMVQDEAINDYRALYALESRIGRNKVMDLIRQEAGMELSFRQYPKGDEFITGLREKVNLLLAQEL
ncbi:MAG TPA: hypothetical protein DCZ91_08280 [Lachnospiraceae bacterium]|nr:hypothetical protein [Lachnospiraceae bacterium]